MNVQTIRQWYDVFKGNKDLTEIRILDNNSKRTYSGYFTDIENLLTAIKPYDNCNIYFTLNKIDDACYSREQHDRIVIKPKSTTSDKEIIARDWILIDIDCEKPSDTNSTDEEKAAARLIGNQVYKFLSNEGFNEGVACDSANGFHLLYRCAMLNNEKNTETVKNFLQMLDVLFSTDKVKIDTTTFNASRICKLYGCISRKGSNTKSRPQRESKIIKVPSEIKVTPNEYFEKIASMLPKQEKPSQSNRYSLDSFDVEEFIKKHNISIRNTVQTASYTKYILEECPFDSSHRAPDSAIFKMSNGSIGFRCLHNSCAQYTWKDFRLHFEPDAYDKKDYNEYQQKRRYNQPINKEEFKPLAETADKGKKWLSMEDIKYIDINSIVAIPTGYYELDRKIMGLLLGDVSVISGISGCVDCDTEFFDGKKWKKISDYKYGDMVLQYNLDGSANMVYPNRYIKVPCDNLNLLKTKYGVNQCICDDHRIVYQTSKGNLNIKKCSEVKEMYKNSKHGFSGKFYTTFKYNGLGINLSEYEIRLMCAVICDGTFTSEYANKKICRLNIKKNRKKERLEWILKNLNLDYRKEQYNPNDLEYNSYIFESPRIEKIFSSYWYNCSNSQMEIICDEVLRWDGSICNNRMEFSTTIKDSADFIQFCFSSCGYRATIGTFDRRGEEHITNNKKYIKKSIEYEVRITSRKMVSMFNNKKQFTPYKTKDGFKYCFTVPSSMLVLRRGDRINITGNCGKTSWIDCLCLNVIQKGYKVAIWSGELQGFRFQGWINQIAAGKNHVYKKDGYDNIYYAPKNICDKINTWDKDKLFLYNNEYGSKWNQLFNDVKEVVEEKGVNLIVIDNLMSLNISGYEGDKYSQQTQFINDLKEYAKISNTHIILVCHPRKESGFLRKESISGTADLTNLCDNLFIIHRVGKDFQTRASEFLDSTIVQNCLQYDSVVEVCKNRSMGIIDYIVGMYYENESRRLKNSISEHIVYGWEEQPKEQTIEYIKEDDFKVLPASEVPF